MPRPISDKKAGETDKACVRASLAVLQEEELLYRIIDKISEVQFHKIIMNIKADLDKGYARAKRSAAAKDSTPKRLYTLRKNKENS